VSLSSLALVQVDDTTHTRERCTNLVSKGIGRATAVLFAARGCERICIADVNQSGLEETKRLVAAESPSVKILVALTGQSDQASLRKVFDLTRPCRCDFRGLC
jgi:hypothetical protein